MPYKGLFRRINAAYGAAKKSTDAAFQEEAQERVREITDLMPNCTDALLEFLRHAGERLCGCPHGEPMFKDIVINPISGETERLFVCSECDKPFYKYRDFSSVIFFLADRGMGKTSGMMKVVHELKKANPFYKVIFFRTAPKFVNLYRNVLYCKCHDTTCAKALGKEPFRAMDGAVNYYDDDGNLVRGKPPAVLESRACRLCKENSRDVRDCARNCPFYQCFGDGDIILIDSVFDIIDDPEKFVNGILVIDEISIALAATRATTKESVDVEYFWRLLRQKRIFCVCSSQDMRFAKGIRAELPIVIYKGLSRQKIEQMKAADDIIREYEKQLETLPKSTGILYSTFDGLQERWTDEAGEAHAKPLLGYIKITNPQFYTEDMGMAWDSAASMWVRNERAKNDLLTAIEIADYYIAQGYELQPNRQSERALRGFIQMHYGMDLEMASGLVGKVIDMYCSYQANHTQYAEERNRILGIQPESLPPPQPEQAARAREMQSDLYPVILTQSSVDEYYLKRLNLVSTYGYSPETCLAAFMHWAADRADQLAATVPNRDQRRVILRSVYKANFALLRQVMAEAQVEFTVPNIVDWLQVQTVAVEVGLVYAAYSTSKKLTQFGLTPTELHQAEVQVASQLVIAIKEVLIQLSEAAHGVYVPDEGGDNGPDEIASDAQDQIEGDARGQGEWEGDGGGPEPEPEPEAGEAGAGRGSQQTNYRAGEEAEQAFCRRLWEAGGWAMRAVGSGGARGSGRPATDIVAVEDQGEGGTLYPANQLKSHNYRQLRERERWTESYPAALFETEVRLYRRIWDLCHGEHAPVCPHCQALLEGFLLLGDSPRLFTSRGDGTHLAYCDLLIGEERMGKTYVLDTRTDTITVTDSSPDFGASRPATRWLGTGGEEGDADDDDEGDDNDD